MLACISKLSLFIGNLLMSIIIFFYMSFLHDLSQLSARVSLWHSTVLEMSTLAIISLIGTILGFITRRNHMKRFVHVQFWDIYYQFYLQMPIIIKESTLIFQCKCW